MTTISATQYASYYSLTGGGSAAAKTGVANTAAHNPTSTGATTITLSEAARSALAGKDFSTVVSDARTALDNLLSDSGHASPLKDGKPAIDLGKLDRREIFAIASNAEGRFTSDEQSAAKQEMLRRFDTALAGPAAVARVTGELQGLYEAAADFLDEASSEERATPEWAARKAAVVDALKQLARDPDELPSVDNDPVADYLERVESGEVTKPRTFIDVATDARAALDKQIADAKADGVEIVYSKMRRTGRLVDFSQFDSRSISAIALNEGDKFSNEEVFAAKAEMRTRSGAALLASFKSAADTDDPTAFGKNIISAFASMTAEERSAAGWSDSFYAAALQNYESSVKLTEMLGGASSSSGSGVMSLLGYL